MVGATRKRWSHGPLKWSYEISGGADLWVFRGNLWGRKFIVGQDQFRTCCEIVVARGDFARRLRHVRAVGTVHAEVRFSGLIIYSPDFIGALTIREQRRGP